MNDPAPIEFGVSTVEELDELNRREGWNVEYRQMESGRLNAQYTIRQTGFGFHTLESFDRTLEVRCEPPPGMGAAFIVDQGEVRVNGQAVTTDDWILLPPATELVGSTPRGIRVITVFAPAERFDLHRFGLHGTGKPCLDEFTVVHGGRDVANAIRKAHLDLLFEEPDGGTTEASAEVFTRMLSGAVRSRKRTHDGERSRTAVQRARRYIEEHLDQPLMLPEVCRHAGVGLRSLERYFIRQVGIGPKRYITARRLDRVRRALRAGRPETTDVTSVALSMGFRHLGRFAGLYHEFFGEYPSQTLRGEGISALSVSG